MSCLPYLLNISCYVLSALSPEHQLDLSDRLLSPTRLSPVNWEPPAVLPKFLSTFADLTGETLLRYSLVTGEDPLPSASRLPTSARGLEKSASPPSPIAVHSPQGLVDDGNGSVLSASFPSFSESLDGVFHFLGDYSSMSFTMFPNQGFHELFPDLVVYVDGCPPLLHRQALGWRCGTYLCCSGSLCKKPRERLCSPFNFLGTTLVTIFLTLLAQPKIERLLSRILTWISAFKV